MAITSTRVLWGVTAAACGFAAGLLAINGGRSPADDPQRLARETLASGRLAYEQTMRVAALADEWRSTPDYDYAVNALEAAPVRSDAARPRFDPQDMYWGLPRTPGHDMVAAWCGGCHSLSLVMQQEASPERWRHVLTWMTEKQGMPPLSAEEEAAILAYLARHFGVE